MANKSSERGHQQSIVSADCAAVECVSAARCHHLPRLIYSVRPFIDISRVERASRTVKIRHPLLALFPFIPVIIVITRHCPWPLTISDTNDTQYLIFRRRGTAVSRKAAADGQSAKPSPPSFSVSTESASLLLLLLLSASV